MRRFLIALALTAGPAAAAPSQRFDLICTGTESRFGSTARSADTRRYTIDLAAKRWCRTGECPEGLPIQAVTPDEITFIRSAPGAYMEHRHFITRTTGEYRETIDDSRAVGLCTPAPFSGFPKAKF